MEVHTFRKIYRGREAFPLFFASDIHGDEHGFDRDLFVREFDRAKADGARIFINGDVFGAILPQDIKRYARGSDPGETDAKINAAIDTLADLLAPYANHIDMIGCGNHETAVLKYHSTDLTAFLVRDLNKARDKKLQPIRHGGYTGFIEFVFTEKDKGHTQIFTIFYNHGQGGSAEVTDGIIDAKRRINVRSDAIWLGHKHKRWAHEIDADMGVNSSHQIYTRKRYAIMTGTYLKNAGQTDASKDGYRLNYAEERMRTLQGTGGIRGSLTVSRDGIMQEYTV